MFRYRDLQFQVNVNYAYLFNLTEFLKILMFYKPSLHPNDSDLINLPITQTKTTIVLRSELLANVRYLH